MKKYLLFLGILLSFFTNAQNQGDVAQNFGNYNGFNYYINKIILQTDGKILIGGSFTSYNGKTEKFFTRLNTDGSKDTSFNTGTGFNDQVKSIALQNDGKIIVGGNFTSYQGIIENRLIRLNEDGSKDTSFIIGTGFDQPVTSIALQNDGKIIVGGNFTSYQGIIENNIIRLNADGSKDSSFITGTGFNSSITPYGVFSIAVQSDGKILVGGAFTSYQGVLASNIIRLNNDGSIDNTFSTGAGFDQLVTSIALQNDGKILVGGSFWSYKGVTENRITRLNTDGSKDISFNTGTGSSVGFDNYVSTISLQSDGKIILGGYFSSYQGVTANRIIRLNNDGTTDNSFNSGDGFNTDNNSIIKEVNSIAVQNDGKILVGGSFRFYQGEIEMGIIRLNTNGSKNISFYSGTGFIGGPICDVALQSDGKIIVGGEFIKYKGLKENRLIRLNEDGSKDTSFNTGTGFENTVKTIVLQINGKILVGGYFESYQGTLAACIIRLNADGSIDNTFSTGAGFTSPVRQIVLQNDGKILVGVNQIIRLNTDGSRDTSFTAAGVYSNVSSLLIQSDGKILVGGSFRSFTSNIAKYITRLNADGSRDTSFMTGTGFNSSITSIALQNDGKILVSGPFSSYQGVSANRIIRLNADGSIDNTFSTGAGLMANSIAVQNDGKILVGGDGYANQIIRLNTDGSIDTSFITGTGFLGLRVNKIVLQNDGEILVGGDFCTYQINNESAYLIKLHGNTILESESFNDKKTFMVYPNPAKDQITIDFTNNTNTYGWNYKIINTLGQEVLNGVLSSQKSIVDLNNVKGQGIYFVKIYNSSKTLIETKKIIIQK